ncbi:hypothetical protein F4781DRAFT_379074 [Annulohypoxylon bovei var. microspora]|nr:hypothetical protein F4781DRAFT_379074 [Annulohypoxylon bovei var. microspora]
MAGPSNAGLTLPLNDVQSHNRNSTPQIPLTPYDFHTSMQQSQSHSIMFDRVENARRQAGSREYNFYTDEDINNYSPMGWPSLAAKQTYSPNLNSQRVFGPSTQQVLTCYQQKIQCIDNKLDEMNFKESGPEGRPLGSLTFDPEQFIDRCSRGVGHLPAQPPGSGAGELDLAIQRENLIMSKEFLLKGYCESLGKKYYNLAFLAPYLVQLLHMQYENKKFAKVSRLAHEAHFDMRRREGLSNEALAFMRHIDDFVFIAPDYIFQRFEFLLYNTSPWVIKLLKHLCCLCGGTPPSSETDDLRVAYSARPFYLCIKALIVFGSLSLMVIPVSLLYLKMDWSRGIYLAVVFISSAIFALAMAMFESRTDHLLVGLAAYYAVLVAFLSNLPNYATA